MGITIKVTPAVEEKPDKEAHYDGDEAAMYQFIARNIRYPKSGNASTVRPRKSLSPSR